MAGHLPLGEASILQKRSPRKGSRGTCSERASLSRLVKLILLEAPCCPVPRAFPRTPLSVPTEERGPPCSLSLQLRLSPGSLGKRLRCHLQHQQDPRRLRNTAPASRHTQDSARGTLGICAQASLARALVPPCPTTPEQASGLLWACFVACPTGHSRSFSGLTKDESQQHRQGP